MPIRKRTAMGLTRSKSRDAAEMLAARAPQAMREHLAPFAGEYCDCLLADMRDPESDGHRTAMQVYPRIMKAVGEDETVIAAILSRLGVSSIDQLESRFERFRSADAVTVEAAEQRAIELLQRISRSDPTAAQRHASALGFIAPQRAVDPATNGHANGHANGYTNGNGRHA